MKRSPLLNRRPLVSERHEVIGSATVLSERRRSLLRLKGMAKAERSRLRLAGQFGPQAELCRKGPCQACGKSSLCDAHHEPPRSRGGKDRDTAALCKFDCHPFRHSHGRAALEERCGRSIASMVEEMRQKVAGVSA